VRVGGGKAGKKSVETDFFDEDLGESSSHDYTKEDVSRL